MIDVLVFLFENYFDFRSHPAPETLVRKLSAVGFDPEEVSSALDWLGDLRAVEADEFSANPHSFRIYTAEEHARLGANGLSFISFLTYSGILTSAQRELMIDRALSLEGAPISISRLKIVALMVLWSQEKSLDPLIIEELLDVEDQQLLH